MAAFYSNLKVNEETLNLWHRRCGHLNRQDLLRLAEMSTGMDDLRNKVKEHGPMCESCKRAK